MFIEHKCCKQPVLGDAAVLERLGIPGCGGGFRVRNVSLSPMGVSPKGRNRSQNRGSEEPWGWDMRSPLAEWGGDLNA